VLGIQFETWNVEGKVHGKGMRIWGLGCPCWTRSVFDSNKPVIRLRGHVFQSQSIPGVILMGPTEVGKD